MALKNYYIALLDTLGKPQVSLPGRKRGLAVDGRGCISGLRGALSTWNGEPLPWCEEIIEVLSQGRWVDVSADEKTTLWKRAK